MGENRINDLEQSIQKKLPKQYKDCVIWPTDHSAMFLHRNLEYPLFMRIGSAPYFVAEVIVYDPHAEKLDNAVRKGVKSVGCRVQYSMHYGNYTVYSIK